MEFLGAVALLFAAALLVMPSMRVLQGRLTPYHATGLWLSGTGFLLLALAALVLPVEMARHATLVGVALAVVGNIVQRSRTKPPSGG
jgi:hypothetical protein